MESCRLYGRWRYVAAERGDKSGWEPSKDFVKGLVWEFQPIFIGESKTIGSIAEINPDGEISSLSYIHDHKLRLLKIELHDDDTADRVVDPMFEIYRIRMEEGSGAKPQRLSITVTPRRWEPEVKLCFTLQKEVEGEQE